MVSVKGVKNLVWVWNPEYAKDMDWNPGEAKYDVISLDIYDAWDYTTKYTKAYKELSANYGVNKIFAVSENGSIPDIHFSIESLTNYILGESLTATAICGLGSPERFIEDLRTFGTNIEKTIIRPDHDKQFTQVIEAELSQGKHVVISQKDACRLPQPFLTNPKLHVTVQKITLSKKAQELIDKAISTQTL
jgi:hypothetical protein